MIPFTCSFLNEKMLKRENRLIVARDNGQSEVWRWVGTATGSGFGYKRTQGRILVVMGYQCLNCGDGYMHLDM